VFILSHRQGKTHKLLDFFAGKGFYVVLILCVAAIGASGYMLFFGGPGETPDSPSLALVSPGSASPSSAPAPRVSAAPPDPSQRPAALPPSSPPPLAAPSPSGGALPQSGAHTGNGNDITDVSGMEEGDDVATAGIAPAMPSVPPGNAEPAPSPRQSAADTAPTFYPPVSGELLIHYSESADVFFEALREWRYHPGVDIETGSGALVRAAADGVIKDVVENAPRNMGATIVIEHSGGYTTVYSNLSSTQTVTVGKAVKAGDTIGAVGETALSEQALPPHLHFEILKDGEPVDPMDYLP
jgi:murein DD-endopeptidase MepM/ murein hydrolase activator NlpD